MRAVDGAVRVFRPLLAAEIGRVHSDSAHLLRQVDRGILCGRVRLHRGGRSHAIDHEVHTQFAVRLILDFDSYFCRIRSFRIRSGRGSTV